MLGEPKGQVSCVGAIRKHYDNEECTKGALLLCSSSKGELLL